MWVKIVAEGRTRYLNLAHVTAISVHENKALVFFVKDEAATIAIDSDERDQLEAALDAVIGGQPGSASAGVKNKPFPDKYRQVSIVKMTRGETRSSASPLWRCLTADGLMVNVFKHADPLKDNFLLFVDAGYASEMEKMQIGDELIWTTHPVRCVVQADGGWWRIADVETRARGAYPDPPEAIAAVEADREEFATLAKLKASGFHVLVDEDSSETEGEG
jgi:hypothetical protein